MSSRWRMGFRLFVAGALIASFALAGCAPKGGGQQSQTTTGAQKGGVLTYEIGEPSFLDPKNAFESEGIEVVQAVFDSLVVLDHNGKLAPAAAESWSSNADASVWTFKLKKDGKFSDGNPVTAKDFVYQWNRIATSAVRTPKAPSDIAYQMAAIKGYDEANTKGVDMSGLKAIDDFTLEVTLQYPWADFPVVTAHPCFCPAEQTLVENGVPYKAAGSSKETTVAFSEMPVGNGPFKFSEPWKHNQYVKTVRSTEFPGTQPYIDGITFKIYKSIDTAFRDFQAGTIDFTQIPPGQIEAAVAKYGKSPDGYTINPGKQALTGFETATYYYVINNKDPILKNQKLREALSLAVNREVVGKVAYEGTRVPADGFVPKTLAGYQPGQWPTSHFDRDAAKKALADAGYPGGKGLPTFKININSGAGHEKPAELIRSDWEAIGVHTKIEGLQAPQHWAKLQAGDYQIGRAGWIADYPIVDNFTYPEFFSTAGDNYSKYSNPEVDAALMKARATLDDAARIKAYEDIQKTIGSTTPLVPIVWYAHSRVGSSRVHDFFYSNFGLTDFNTVWLSSATPAQ